MIWLHIIAEKYCSGVLFYKSYRLQIYLHAIGCGSGRAYIPSHQKSFLYWVQISRIYQIIGLSFSHLKFSLRSSKQLDSLLKKWKSRSSLTLELLCCRMQPQHPEDKVTVKIDQHAIGCGQRKSLYSDRQKEYIFPLQKSFPYWVQTG